MTEYNRLSRLSATVSRGALALLLMAHLAGPASAGPSQTHFGSYPQGHHGQLSTSPSAQGEQQKGPAPDLASPQESEANPPTELACPGDGRHYRKSLLITALPRQEHPEANAGGLWGAEQALAQRLGAQLAGGDQLFRHQIIGQSLPEQATNPSQPIRQLAREHASQLVLSGKLVDRGMARPEDTLNPSLTTRTRNVAVRALRLWPEWDSRQRTLVLQLTLYNGHTGQPLHQKTYDVQGVWNPKRPERARFGTPAFWATDYGQALERTLEIAGEELNELIRCQPLMARLEPPRAGRPQLLHAGRAQGLEAGDRLALQRISLRQIPGEYRQYSAHTLDSGAYVRVEKTYTNYSEVRLESPVTLHGEHIAVTPGQATSHPESYTWLGE